MSDDGCLEQAETVQQRAPLRYKDCWYDEAERFLVREGDRESDVRLA